MKNEENILDRIDKLLGESLNADTVTFLGSIKDYYISRGYLTPGQYHSLLAAGHRQRHCLLNYSSICDAGFIVLRPGRTGTPHDTTACAASTVSAVRGRRLTHRGYHFYGAQFRFLGCGNRHRGHGADLLPARA